MCRLTEHPILGGEVDQIVPAELRGRPVKGQGISGVLDESAHDGEGQVGFPAVTGLSQDAQGLGITLEVLQIPGHLRGEPGPQGPVLIRDGVQMLPEPLADQGLPEVAEGGIAQVVEEPRAHEHRGDITGRPIRQRFLPPRDLSEILHRHLPQLPGHGGHLDGVGQPGAHEVALVQGEHLGLVLKTPEGGAGDDGLIVLLKLVDGVPVKGLRLPLRLCQPFHRQQVFPVHRRPFPPPDSAASMRFPQFITVFPTGQAA